MSLRSKELRDCLSKKIHVDEYQAKMGKDEDVIVFSFKIKYRDQGNDLVNFLEKGYDWVLDADLSSGELEDGSYLVFLEMQRRPSVPTKLLHILNDMENITGIAVDSYKFSYHNSKDYQPLTVENLSRIPLSPRDYRKKHNIKDNDDHALEQMQMQAGLDPSKHNPNIDEELRYFVNLSKR